MAKYFGTNGVRGKFDEFTPELALTLARATGAYLKRGKIIVARDGRLTSETLRNAIVAGLMGVGCEVIDIGIAPSPVAEFLIRKHDANGAIMITASHNPPEWNGMKVVDGKGISVSRERGEEIEKLIGKTEAAPWDKVGGFCRCGDFIREYLDAVKKEVKAGKIAKRKPKLVLDCGNGTASVIAPELFRELGCEIVLMNQEIDGRFPGRPSEPTRENVKELIAKVPKEKADVGIAWDGDCDRVVLVDEKGEYVIGDRVFALCALLRLREKKGDIVTTVATSKAIEDIAKKFGVRVRYTKIGAPYLSEEMAKGGAAIGGEEVGGIILPEISLAKDGFSSIAKIVEALSEKKLSEWMREVPAYANVKERIPADEKRKGEIVGRMKKYAKENKLAIIDIDGIRINLEDGWIIVRASGTENYVRIFAEAKTESKAKEYLEKYRKIALG
ncbi:phosphoglucosamine mutase [Candidatus Micrarchaeota archaeon]|nr:phosphoglucosamine mutase [Candidatus Micrarchaeota archaeon]